MAKDLRKVKEAKVVADIKKYLDSLGDDCFYHKEHGGMYGTKGLPDIHVCYKGIYIAIECKRPVGGRLTNLQANTLDKMARAGALTLVAQSVDEVKEIIEGIKVWRN